MCPNYTFKDLNSNEEETLFMSNQEREEYLKNNPHIVQLLTSALPIGDSIRMGRQKPDGAFRDRLKEIKKAHSKGFTRATVNTM